MKLEVLANPLQGITKDDLLGAAVSAAETVDRASARRYRGGLVSIFLVAPELDVRAITREVARLSVSAPEVTTR